MRLVALVLNALAAVGGLYDARRLIFDVALEDLKQSRTAGSWLVLAATGVASLLLVGVPLAVGGGLAWRGHAGWSLLVAVGSLVASAIAFVVVSGAFS
jgi:hypothetical protein